MKNIANDKTATVPVKSLQLAQLLGTNLVTTKPVTPEARIAWSTGTPVKFNGLCIGKK